MPPERIEKERPTAKNILDAVVRAMYEAQEPLDEGVVLVPPVYDILLHPAAYQDLRSLLARIKVQAKRRLDAELERMNRPAERTGMVARLWARIMRLFDADKYVARQPMASAVYERAGTAWSVDIGITADPEAGMDYLAVETDFAAQRITPLKGRPTVNIRRRTMVLPDGRFETVLTTERVPPAGRGEPASAPTHALARLRYEDDAGPHIFYMTRPEIRLGRKDGETTVDVALVSLPDVSREHACIRHEAERGGFAIKDLSRFGVTVDGEKIPTGLSDDASGWHPLPSPAQIGLANVVFISFESL